MAHGLIRTEAGLGLAGRGVARRGAAGLGLAGHGGAWQGRQWRMDLFGLRQGLAWRGRAWRGMARRGEAWLGKGANGATHFLRETDMDISFRLTGKTPILMHADDILQADALERWRKDPGNKNQSKAGDDRSPPWTWQTYLYHDGDNLCIPSANLMVCLRGAAAQIPLKGNKTYKEMSQSGMMIQQEFMQFRYGPELRTCSIQEIVAFRDEPFMSHLGRVEELGFRLFAKRAAVSKSKHVRVRPRFDQWQVTGTLLVISPDLTLETIEMMFRIAQMKGLCDWRPGGKTPGPFGTFAAELSAD